MKLRVGLVTAVALVLLASPLAVKAQQTGKVWRIGILGSENTRPWESFRQALRELGYVEGRNLVLEQRWSEGITDRLPALATELVQLRVDVIVASGTQGVRAAMQATRTIPIVMAVSAYPEYENQRQGLGLDFTLTIQRTYERLLESPASGAPFGRRLRRVLVPKFPYGLLYRVEAEADRIYIIAVMHLQRRPGYWRSRL